jgi:hypothetical protein
MNSSSVKVAEDDGRQVWVFCMHLVQTKPLMFFIVCILLC